MNSLLSSILTFYSRSSEIKAFIDSNSDSGEVKIGENAENSIDKSSDNNSLIIETRNIKLANGSKLSVNFVSTADMRQEAKGLIIKFLPISLAVSLSDISFSITDICKTFDKKCSRNKRSYNSNDGA